ncbi:hypothetical protein ACFUJ0_35650, partial [Streptomyces sp. NPDC057242]
MTSGSGSSVFSGVREGLAVAVVGAVVGVAGAVAEGGAAEPVDAPGLAEAPEAEAEGVVVAEGEGDADVRRGFGDDDVGSGLPEEGDGSSDTARFRSALVVTSGTAARSSVSPAPARAAARA